MKYVKTFGEFINESKLLNEKYDYAANEDYWQDVVKELNKLIKGKSELAEFESGSRKRNISIELPSGAYLNILHDWGRDGTSTKPFTVFSVDDENIEEELGRYAIWDDANWTADDIANWLKDNKL